MSSLVNWAFDIFLCSPIFANNAAMINELLDFLDIFLMLLESIFSSVVYPHDLRFVCVDM
jgi:hypothetical protein